MKIALTSSSTGLAWLEQEVTAEMATTGKAIFTATSNATYNKVVLIFQDDGVPPTFSEDSMVSATVTLGDTVTVNLSKSMISMINEVFLPQPVDDRVWEEVQDNLLHLAEKWPTAFRVTHGQ